MSEWKYTILALMNAIGFFSLGYLWGIRRVSFWRLKWVEMEHDLARLQQRYPRHIELVSRGDSDNGGN
jgi:hypothetical protein